jgi:hypothetical protein
MKRTIHLTAFVAIILGFSGLLGVAVAQIPTLDPEQTVNVATGEMGFNLPLGTVRGVKGHDFPVNLSYKAGILFDQEASDVGLGFSYGAGAITRKVVSVPDNNNGPYTYQPGSPIKCDEAETDVWRVLILAIVNFLENFFPPLAYYSIVDLIWKGIANDLSNDHESTVFYSISDYRSRIGEYYDWKENTGKGFFKNGESTDAPDIYIVSTPFIAGELVWIGGPANGHFVFKTTQGCALKGEETIQVDYVYQNGFSNEKFIIKLADGTRLIFKVTDTYGNLSIMQSWGKFLHDGDVCGFRGSQVEQMETSPCTWWLTAVLYNDYIDGGGDMVDPSDSYTTNKGSWIAFEYTPRVCQGIYQKKDWDFQVDRSGTYRFFQGGRECIFQQLTKVKTPVEEAEFVYSDEPRLDNLYEAGKDNFFRRPRLAKILFSSLNEVCYRQIDFKTSYTLRPGSHHSFSSSGECGNVDQGYRNPLEGNPNAACLTLNQVVIADASQSKPKYIHFLYGLNPDVTVFTGQTVPLKPGAADDGSLQTFIEKKDIWGYYCRIPRLTGTSIPR